MADTATRHVLTEAIWPAEGAALWAKRAVLVVLGIAALTVSAQIRVPVWPSPVLMNLGTFAVLTIAAAYGPRLGLVTMAGWLLIGAIGFDVFQSSTADNAGLAYMAGPTGGYLVGYVLAAAACGWLAERGWDRNVLTAALAMLVGNIVLYVPGLLWLGVLFGWDKPILEWGLTPFILGDVLKLALVAAGLPLAWKLLARKRG